MITLLLQKNLWGSLRIGMSLEGKVPTSLFPQSLWKRIYSEYCWLHCFTLYCTCLPFLTAPPQGQVIKRNGLGGVYPSVHCSHGCWIIVMAVEAGSTLSSVVDYIALHYIVHVFSSSPPLQGQVIKSNGLCGVCIPLSITGMAAELHVNFISTY